MGWYKRDVSPSCPQVPSIEAATIASMYLSQCPLCMYRYFSLFFNPFSFKYEETWAQGGNTANFNSSSYSMGRALLRALCDFEFLLQLCRMSCIYYVEQMLQALVYLSGLIED